jgi:ferredoxin like protein
MDIEAKLGLDVFAIDPEPHIVIDPAICRAECRTPYCLHVCPAGLYTRDAQDQVQVNYEGCLECGTCLVACVHQALAWHYPRAGHGVQYRFG